ncbi:hypothetical protein BDD12DRAFT_945980, partial [Trichophaea hybrida]
MTVKTKQAMLKERSASTAGGACQADCQIRTLPNISSKCEYHLSMLATPSHAGALALAVSNHHSNYHYSNHHLLETLVDEAVAQLASYVAPEVPLASPKLQPYLRVIVKILLLRLSLLLLPYLLPEHLHTRSRSSGTNSSQNALLNTSMIRRPSTEAGGGVMLSGRTGVGTVFIPGAEKQDRRLSKYARSVNSVAGSSWYSVIENDAIDAVNSGRVDADDTGAVDGGVDGGVDTNATGRLSALNFNMMLCLQGGLIGEARLGAP